MKVIFVGMKSGGLAVAGLGLGQVQAPSSAEQAPKVNQ